MSTPLSAMLLSSILLLFALVNAVTAQCNCQNDCPAPASCSCGGGGRTRYIIVRPASGVGGGGGQCAPSCTPTASQCSQSVSAPAPNYYPAPAPSYSYPAPSYPAPAAPQVSYQSAPQQVAPSFSGGGGYHTSGGGGGGGYSTGGGGGGTGGGDGGYHARVHSFAQTQQVDGSQEGDEQNQEAATGEEAESSFAEQDARKARSSKTVSADPKCNSVQLRKVMEEQMVATNPNESKRRIHKATNGDADKGVDVICSTAPFSYRIATDLFCETTKANVVCFAFQHYNSRR